MPSPSLSFSPPPLIERYTQFNYVQLKGKYAGKRGTAVNDAMEKRKQANRQSFATNVVFCPVPSVGSAKPEKKKEAALGIVPRVGSKQLPSFTQVRVRVILLDGPPPSASFPCLFHLQ